MVYEVVEKKNAVNLQGLRGVFLYVENESKVGNKLPRTETILWLENIWRVSGSFEQSNFFFFFSSVFLEMLQNYWNASLSTGSTESDRGDSTLVKAWNDSSVTAVHS